MAVTGLTTGCFDLLHYSHLLYLQRCRSLCDRLIVGVDSDEMAFILRDLSELPVIVRRFEITKVFKHESFWNIENVMGVTGTGADLVIIPDIPGMVSTTDIINRIIERYGNPSKA
jgi:cytidyltransferase-like protein